MAALDGQVAFITGGGSGIGQAMALAFAAEGAIVGVADIDAAAAKQTVVEIVRRSGVARPIAVDISRRDQALAAVADLVAEFGRLDCVANNAMVFSRQPLAEVREDTVERLLAVGLKALLWTAQAALAHMDGERGGVIINNTSPVAQMGAANTAVYTSVKGGVSSLTRALAVEFGPRRIRVNAVCPGAVPTPGARTISDDAVYEARRLRTPLGRLGTPEDVADAAVFLASPAARFITGEILHIDGGVTIFGGR